MRDFFLKGNVTTNITETQNSIRKHHAKLYTKMLENIKDLNKFVDTYDPARLLKTIQTDP